MIDLIGTPVKANSCRPRLPDTQPFRGLSRQLRSVLPGTLTRIAMWSNAGIKKNVKRQELKACLNDPTSGRSAVRLAWASIEKDRQDVAEVALSIVEKVIGEPLSESRSRNPKSLSPIPATPPLLGSASWARARGGKARAKQRRFLQQKSESAVRAPIVVAAITNGVDFESIGVRPLAAMAFGERIVARADPILRLCFFRVHSLTSDESTPSFRALRAMPFPHSPCLWHRP